MKRLALAAAALAWAGAATADLYRWVDPESGSIKYSNYPPPWYGDPAKERRAPKVEVIPERSSAPSSGSKPDEEARPEARPAAKPAARPEARSEARREARPADRSPDRPADKPDGAAAKERPADGR